MNLLIGTYDPKKVSPDLAAKAKELEEAMAFTVFKDASTGKMFNADAASNEHGVVDYLAYYMHPMEREARASEDMLTKSLDDRARTYLKGEDSSPRGAYRDPNNIVDVLYKLFVTGELDASQHMMPPTKTKIKP
jgi:hypothetical protein